MCEDLSSFAVLPQRESMLQPTPLAICQVFFVVPSLWSPPLRLIHRPAAGGRGRGVRRLRHPCVPPRGQHPRRVSLSTGLFSLFSSNTPLSPGGGAIFFWVASEIFPPPEPAPRMARVTAERHGAFSAGSTTTHDSKGLLGFDRWVVRRDWSEIYET